jgi:hypothetical protein
MEAAAIGRREAWGGPAREKGPEDLGQAVTVAAKVPFGKHRYWRVPGAARAETRTPGR